MSDCAENKNPLTRHGTSQGERMLNMLSPESVEVIDKKPEDWMVWAGKFSDYVHFYALNNAPTGSMLPFFNTDISVNLAYCVSYSPDMLSVFFREKLRRIEKDSAELKVRYSELYDAIFSYLTTVDKLYERTKDDRQFSTILLNHIRARLLPLEKRAISYYKASEDTDATKNLIVHTQPSVDIHIFHSPLLNHEEAKIQGLSSLNGLRYPESSDFNTYYGNITPDESIFGGLTGFQQRIKYAAQHNFFTSILDEIVASAAFITRQAANYLDKYLSDWPNHVPNYALFLTWLLLLKSSKQHLNELTGRHLDFYYKKILRLRPLGQIADEAFLVVELNKTTPVLLVKKDRIFEGPKDSAGDKIHYRNVRETILNKASIVHLQGLYYATDKDNIGTTINAGHLFAAPVINSTDGLGEKLPDPGAWHPFHNKTYVNGDLTSLSMPLAEIGFAFSSHYLRLREGLREIVLEITPQNSVKLNELHLKAFITTEKEWHEIEELTVDLDKSGSGNIVKITLTMILPASVDPVTSYDQAVHEGTMTATEPVVMFRLIQDQSEASLYHEVSKIELGQVSLTVKAGLLSGVYNEDGLKNLEVHNDNSPLNPSKPFLPWGTEPTPGNAIIIGSEELFYKPNATVQVNLKWKDLPLDTAGDIAADRITYVPSSTNFTPFNSAPSDGEPPAISLQVLRKSKWEELASSQEMMKSGGDIDRTTILPIDLTDSSKMDAFLDKDDAWATYSTERNRGFIRLALEQDYGHRDYYLALQEYFKDDSITTAPAYPYQPTLEGLSLSYEATCEIDLSATSSYDAPISFFHSGPFGDAERNAVLQGSAPTLISRWISSVEGVTHDQGSLFIGLANCEPGDSQSILFQVMEGSEDPLLEKPEDHLIWEYLGDHNTWKPFDKNQVNDQTRGMIESGLVILTIPADASLQHTSMEDQLIWIRISVTQAANAVSKILGIYPNAFKVVRQIPDKKIYMDMVSPAGGITKPSPLEAAMKKIQQPYNSFGGKPMESSGEFYQRASEQLRHKNRAITIWDIERLVLQAFPEIYKVKCLNHTKIGGSLSEGDLVYNEVAPGHVAVITIPRLSGRNDTDPLKPYTKTSTLQRIEEFLKQRSSCQVKIKAAQPVFEEIKVKCTITLRKGYKDPTWYREEIQRELTKFLSPWAFEDTEELNFGGEIHSSVLVDFIEELPYVDYLTDFELFHIYEDGSTLQSDEVGASTARSILVSVPAEEHDLTILEALAIIQQEIECDEP